MRPPGESFATRDLGALIVLIGCGGLLAWLDGGSAAYAVVAIAFAAALVSPAAITTSIVVAIPFVQDPVAVGGSRWSLLELAILAAASSVTVSILLGIVKTRSLKGLFELLRPWPPTLVAFLLVAAGGVSLFNVADVRYRPDSIREFRWVIVEPVIAFVLFRWAMRRGLRTAIVTLFIGTGVAVALFGVVQLLTGDGVVIADGVQRATGPYEHPNNLALYLERVTVLALGIAAASMFAKRISAIAAALTLIGLAATLSRGAGLAFVTGAAVIAALVRVRHGWRWIGAGAVAAFALIALLGAQRLTDSGSSGATSSRELIWRSSIEMIRDHPVTGVGLDQFLNQYGRRYVEPAGWPERYTSHPHNILLDFWLRLGLPGLLCLAALLGLTAWLIAAAWRDRRSLGFQAGAAGALIAGFTHGLVDNGFFLADLAVMTWLLIAILESSLWPTKECDA